MTNATFNLYERLVREGGGGLPGFKRSLEDKVRCLVKLHRGDAVKARRFAGHVRALITKDLKDIPDTGPRKDYRSWVVECWKDANEIFYALGKSLEEGGNGGTAEESRSSSSCGSG